MLQTFELAELVARETPGITAEVELKCWPVLICVLGDFCVLKQGKPVAIRSGGKSEGLLTTLALVAHRGATREDLLATLWPDHDPSLAGESLNSIIYRLHRLLGDALSGMNPIVNVHGRYRLNSEAGVGVDCTVFDAVVAEATRMYRLGEHASAVHMFELARQLYRGDISTHADFETILERERLRQLFSNILSQLAEHYFSMVDYESCLRHALSLIRHDPIREDTHRMIIRCLVRSGERARALRQYRLCESILRAEFDATPEQATVELFDLVRLNPDMV